MKKFLSLVLALVMTMSLVTIGAGAKDFTDGDKITYDTAVDVMSAVKVVDGYTDGSFNPSATLTRGAAAKIICNLILGPTTAGALKADAAPYKDVPANSTFAGYIAYCAKEGIISGYTDGTFRPGNTLTGYAFMKMLLGALGYDKTTEGYEGANWSINVAKRALNVGLDDGLTADFDGTKPVTREEACLFAFNTLQATMVEYKNNSTIVVGDVTISTNAQASDVVNDDTSYKGSADGKMQFCEKYFPKLKAVNDVDAFGNYITNWKIGTTKVATSTDEPQLTYTTSVKYKDIYADLDLDGSHSFYYFVDGVGQGNISVTKAATTTLGSTGNGVLTSVYHDVDDAEYYNISVVNTYVAKVTSIGKNATTGDREITVTTENDGTTAKLETTEWDVDDMVLVTIDYSATPNKAVKSIEAAEKLSGKLTKISGKEYTIDGTVYKKSAKADMNSVTAGKTVDFILDSYGYIIWADTQDSSVDLTELAIQLDSIDDFEGTRSRLLFLDGSKKTVTTDADYDDYYDGRIVKFELDGSDYELTDVTNSYYYGGSAYSFTNGATTVANTSIKVDGSTVFAYVDVSDNFKLTSYTGYKAAPTVANTYVNGVVAYTKTNATAAAVVVIYVAGIENISSSSNKLLFLATAHNADVIEEEDVSDYYTFNAIDKGTITTVNAIDTMWDDVNEYYTSYAVTGTEEEVVAVYKTATYNKDGQIKTLGRAVEGTDYYRVYSTAAMKNDVLTLGGTGYAVAEDVAVYTMTNGEFAVSSVSAIAKDDSTDKDINGSYDPYVEVVFTKNSDGEVDFVILVVKD